MLDFFAGAAGFVWWFGSDSACGFCATALRPHFRSPLASDQSLTIGQRPTKKKLKKFKRSKNQKKGDGQKRTGPPRRTGLWPLHKRAAKKRQPGVGMSVVVLVLLGTPDGPVCASGKREAF